MNWLNELKIHQYLEMLEAKKWKTIIFLLKTLQQCATAESQILKLTTRTNTPRSLILDLQ